MELVFLLICGGLAVVASLLVIFARSTLHSALWMVVAFFMVAVFILYSIMMLHLRQESVTRVPVRVSKIFGIVALLVLFLEMLLVGLHQSLTAMQGPVTDQLVAAHGRVAVISNFLFSEYLLPFEVASILLTAGVVGAVVLAKRVK